jgi:hypothetical protein
MPYSATPLLSRERGRAGEQRCDPCKHRDALRSRAQ